MVNIKSKEPVALDDSIWENMGSFIADLARNNEDVDDNMESYTELKKSPTNNTASTDNTIRTFSRIQKTDKIKAEEVQQYPGEFSTKYQNLQTDIKSLLNELQEIKKARIDLQNKIDQMQQ